MMKYVVILIVVVALARVDVLLQLFDRVSNKMAEPKDLSPALVVAEPSEVIPLKDDKALERTPRSEFFTLLDDFHLNPRREVRERVVEVLRKNPKILGVNVDPVFEGEIFKLTDLIYNKNQELPYLLVDFLDLLEGENLEMVKRFFTLMLDNDVERFLNAYVKAKDANCVIAGLMGHRVPQEELLNEFMEREQVLTEFLAREKTDPAVQALGKNCHLMIQLQIQKLSPELSSTGEEVPPTQP